MTLEEKYRYKLDENADDSYGTQIWLSFDAKHLCYRNSNSYSFFDGRNGEFQHTHEENLYQYMKFINSNELIGYCHDVTTGFSKLGKYNVRNQESNEIASLNKYYPTIFINSDGRACILENDSILYYVDLKSSDKEPIKLMEGFEIIKS